MKRYDRIAPDGYTEWASDREILALAAGMTKAQLRVANNQGTVAFRAMNSILSRLPKDSQTYADLVEIGQAFYNLLGNVATTMDYLNGNYELSCETIDEPTFEVTIREGNLGIADAVEVK